jgi:hypothetical protein
MVRGTTAVALSAWLTRWAKRWARQDKFPFANGRQFVPTFREKRGHDSRSRRRPAFLKRIHIPLTIDLYPRERGLNDSDSETVIAGSEADSDGKSIPNGTGLPGFQLRAGPG